MECLSISVSTVSSFEDFFAHNMWNPLLDLLSLEQTSTVFVPYFDLAEMALPFHFALVLFCYKERAYDSA